ncbi:MAG: iron uptake transporter deferrochelatase/peroxidase subunit [Motilibacteraceae bacterium]
MSTGRLGRRQVLALGGAGLLAAAGAGGAVAVHEERRDDQRNGPNSHQVPFQGAHQAGITTPVQDRLQMTAFDLTATSRADLVSLLRDWTAAAAAMTVGLPVGDGAVDGPAQAPPDDTGEALGLSPARLTITVGFGPTLFTHPDHGDRFGLATQRPEELTDLPRFRGDALDPARCGGDLVVQACADDPQVAVHAIRNLARIGFGRTAVRWSQLGFGKTSSTTPDQDTPRNLFGFKDGTDNIAADDTAMQDQHIWCGREAPPWLRGGTYLVARRIGMRIETWDRESLHSQEQIIGRTKGEGAPLGAAHEHDPVEVTALPADSHVALAHPSANDGHAILRRGYSYVDGSDGLGRLDAGLFFIAFCRNPHTQYVPLQDKLARQDALAEYLLHTGSGLWACPPGLTGNQTYWGQSLLEG